MEDDDCEICEFAREFAHWPTLDNDLAIANPGDVMKPDHEGRKNIITHCGTSRRAGVTGCHRSWKSLAQGHCTVCHEQFATESTSDHHWGSANKRSKLPGVHTHPSEVETLVSVDEQFGPVWHRSLELELAQQRAVK